MSVLPEIIVSTSLPGFNHCRALAENLMNAKKGRILRHSPQQTSLPPHLCRCPNGRPPCAIVSFGCAGKAVLLQPSARQLSPGIFSGQPAAGGGDFGSFGNMPAGSQPVVVSSQWLLPLLAAGQAPEPSQPAVQAMAEVQAVLQSFPGPLGSGMSRDKLLKYLSDRVDRCAAEEGVTAPERADALRVMWGMLRCGSHIKSSTCMSIIFVISI